MEKDDGAHMLEAVSTHRSRNPRALSLLAVLFALGCRSAPSSPRVLGDVRYVGSSTVGVFMREAEEVYGTIRFEIDTAPESLGGEQAILAGEADLAGIANAPRQATLDAGVVATLIGRDAIAVIVNAKNPVHDLSREALRRIFAGQVGNWRELEGPDLPIEPYVVAVESATRSVFADAVLGGSDYAGCTEASPDRSILAAVASSPGAIGAISFSFLGLEPGVRPIAVDGEHPSVTNFGYPISRPLYLLWREGDAVVEGFLAWSRSSEGQDVLMRNFVGARVLGSVRSNREPDPTGTLIVYTPTYRFYDGGINYYPHRPYEILDRSGGLLRRVANHHGENDETPARVELAPGTYLIRSRGPRGEPAEFFATIEAGKLTELDAAALLEALSGRSPTPRPASAATGERVFDGLKFYGDFRFRGEGGFDQVGKDDDARARVRLRIGANYRISDELLVGMRAATGSPGDPNSSHVTLGDGFDDLEVSLDRAYLSYRPLAFEGVWATVGKFQHTFRQNPVYGELVWDADIQPEGLVVGRSWRDSNLEDRVSATLGGYNVLYSSNGENVHALVGQVTAVADVSDELEGRLSLGGYYYSDVNPGGSTSLIDANAGNAEVGGQYVSQFALANPVLSVEGEVANQPLVASAEYVKNVRAEIDGDQGWAVGASYGSQTRQGDWRVYYQWQVLEQDAVFSPFGQDDFAHQTNFRGHVAGIKFMLTDKMGLHLWTLVSATDDISMLPPGLANDRDQWRLRLDLDTKF